MSMAIINYIIMKDNIKDYIPYLEAMSFINYTKIITVIHTIMLSQTN